MSRIQRILYKLAQREAPHLTPPGWDRQDDSFARVKQLARRLADYGTLTLVGQLTPDLLPLEEIHVQDWVHSYARFYQLLAQALFPPSLTQISAVYADEQQPTIVIFRAPAAPILACFAAYVVPYVAHRQPNADEGELRDLMNLLIDELEAGDLPAHTLEELRYAGIDILVQMLHATVQNISLTDLSPQVRAFLRPDVPRQDTEPLPLQSIAPQTAPPPQTAPQSIAPQSIAPPPAAPPPPPDGVPGGRFDLETIDDPEATPTPTEQMFRINLPIPKPGGTSKRRPPVPPLPDKKDE